MDKNTVLVNIYGGPCVGKTTLALELTLMLKKQGYAAEFVSEPAKKYAYSDKEFLDYSESHQLILLGENIRMIEQFYGKVDFVITDSPFILNSVYNFENDPGYEKMCARINDKFNNANYYLKRNPELKYEEDGRIQGIEKAYEIDEKILRALERQSVACNMISYDPYGVASELIGGL